MAGELNNRIEKLERELRDKDDKIRSLEESQNEMREIIGKMEKKMEETFDILFRNEAKLIDDIWEENFDIKLRIKKLERKVVALNTMVFTTPDDKVIGDFNDFFDE